MNKKKKKKEPRDTITVVGAKTLAAVSLEGCGRYGWKDLWTILMPDTDRRTITHRRGHHTAQGRQQCRQIPTTVSPN